MKNKLTGVALLIALMVVFTSCTSNSLYANASAQNRDIATQALNIADDFLDGIISANVASNRVDNLADIDRDGHPANGIIDGHISLLHTSLMMVIYDPVEQNNDANWDTVLERRNTIAEGLGLSTR